MAAQPKGASSQGLPVAKEGDLNLFTFMTDGACDGPGRFFQRRQILVNPEQGTAIAVIGCRIDRREPMDSASTRLIKDARKQVNPKGVIEAEVHKWDNYLKGVIDSLVQQGLCELCEMHEAMHVMASEPDVPGDFILIGGIPHDREDLKEVQ